MEDTMGKGDPAYQERQGIRDANARRDPNPPKPEQSTWNLWDHRSPEVALDEHRRYLDGYNRTHEAIENSERDKRK
jgi:hypothetical protein